MSDTLFVFRCVELGLWARGALPRALTTCLRARFADIHYRTRNYKSAVRESSGSAVLRTYDAHIATEDPCASVKFGAPA